MTIIGITGTLGAGKGTVVGILVKKLGFKHYSVRDYLLAEVRRRGLLENRDNMTLVANDLRLTKGPGFLMEELHRKAIESGGKAIIESVRTLGEISTLRKINPSFLLLAVDADPKTRYQRIKKRGTVTDNVTFEKFLSDERRESGNHEPWKADLPECIKKADVFFDNNGTIDDLEKQVIKKLSGVIS